MEFHNRLKLMRKRFKATQQNLANYLNINLRTYQRYEAGTIEPPLSTAASIAKYFDVPIDCLTGNGFFSNWEEILTHRDYILQNTKKLFPSLSEYLNLSDLSESQLAHLLPALFEKITFENDTCYIHVHLLISSLVTPSAEAGAEESQTDLPRHPIP